MIELQNIRVSYGTKQALDGVDLTLGPGELVGLHHAGRCTHHPQKYRPFVLCHLRTQLLPCTLGRRAPRILSGALPRLSEPPL